MTRTPVVPAVSACALAVALSFALFRSSPALALRPEPVRALKFQAYLVTAIQPCTASNDTTTTPPLVVSACHPATPIDSVCQFDPLSETANGVFQAKVARKGARQDIKMHVHLVGLNAGCEGLQLCVHLQNLRITTTGCASGDPDGCTMVDVPSFAPGLPACCLVGDGKCRLDTGIDVAAMQNFVDDGKMTIELGGAALHRINGPSVPSGASFVTGLLAP
ncbi:MAG TPA: hypothetical protein VFD92_23715 [Candidatus Binatia bacterium]|nr:hypothetical protein [Candidatus Binatia bacterium]